MTTLVEARDAEIKRKCKIRSELDALFEDLQIEDKNQIAKILELYWRDYPYIQPTDHEISICTEWQGTKRTLHIDGIDCGDPDYILKYHLIHENQLKKEDPSVFNLWGLI